MLLSKTRFQQLYLAAMLSFSAFAQADIKNAISTGNPSLLPQESNIISTALKQIDDYKQGQSKLLTDIYGTGAITYKITANNTQLFDIKEPESVFPLLIGNKGNVLAVYGTVGGRFAAYGSAPTKFFEHGENLNYEEPFKHVLEWLFTNSAVDIKSLKLQKNVALTYTGTEDNHDSIVSWLGKNAPSWKLQICDDPKTISSCYKKQDLLILSWENLDHLGEDAVVLEAIKAHLKAKKPVLYLHTSWRTSSFSDKLSDVLGFKLPYSGNYWAIDSADYSSLKQMNEQIAITSPMAKIERMLQHFKNKDYHFDWSNCTTFLYHTDCRGVPNLNSEFYDGATSVKTMVNGWEHQNLDIFSASGRQLGKLMVLLGDKYRSSITYPMQKGVTDDTTFLKSLYADHAVYTTRKFNPSQPDLGSFSSSLSKLLPVKNATFSFDTKRAMASSTSGYYAPPGKTITLTRKDSNSVDAYVHINMLRDRAAGVFDTYDRPQFLWSEPVPLVTGKIVKVTSPYGGIIFLKADGSETSAKIEISISGIMRQPIFTGDNLEEFKKLLDTSPLNWAEIKFPGIEIHSRIDFMKDSINDPLINGDINRLIGLTTTYIYEDTYNLAGMVAPGLTRPQTVLDFCEIHGWDCNSSTIHGMNTIQHVNADRANCGDGCAGNPYDQNWAFGPLGWGETHEIGHGLQRERLKIYGVASGESSNNIFPLHKIWRFNKLATETQKYGRNVEFSEVLNKLQTASLTADPIESMRLALWVDSDECNPYCNAAQRFNFYWQIAMSSRDVTHLGDAGWDVFRLMYLHERLFSQAIDDHNTWTTQRVNLGFSLYESSPKDISGNDFMLISMSYITERDQRPFFDLWGIKYSNEASNQVASYGFQAVKKNFWVVPNENKPKEEASVGDSLPTPVLIDSKTPL